MAPPISLVLLNSSRDARQKWASVLWWAVTGSLYFTTFTAPYWCIWWFVGTGRAKILGVFLDRNHTKHTHCSCNHPALLQTNTAQRGAAKYTYFKHCLSRGHFILVTQMFVYCAYAESGIIDENWNLDRTTFFLSQKMCLSWQSRLVGEIAVK